jgi:hypothetical protein
MFVTILSSVEQSVLPRRFFSMLHKFLIGFMSGELPGQLSCWFFSLEWTSWLFMSCGVAQGHVEMSLYHLQRSTGMVKLYI